MGVTGGGESASVVVFGLFLARTSGAVMFDRDDDDRFAKREGRRRRRRCNDREQNEKKIY